MSGVDSSCARSKNSGYSGSSSNKHSLTSSGGICEPRRSNRVTKNFSHDGDIWQENLAVCESGNHKLVIRSYFRNTRTGKKSWDEPPTGATHIEQATGDMRQQAEEQLNELQNTVIPGRRKKGGKKVTANKEKGGSSSTNKNKTTSQSKKKVGAVGTSGLFRKILSDNKKSSIFDGIGKGSKKAAQKQKKQQQQLENQRAEERSKQESKYMQIAISSSLDQKNIDNREKKNKQYINRSYSPTRRMKGNSATRKYQEDPEALQLAMMLSISEAEQSKRNQPDKEDLLLRKVLEESRLFTNSNANRSTSQEEKEWQDQRSSGSDWVTNTPTTAASSVVYERHSLDLFEKHQQQQHQPPSPPHQNILINAPVHTVSKNSYQNYKVAPNLDNYLDNNKKTSAIALYDPYGHGKSASPSFDYSEISIPTTIVLNQEDSIEKEEKKLRKMRSLEQYKRPGITSCRGMNKKKMQDKAGLL